MLMLRNSHQNKIHFKIHFKGKEIKGQNGKIKGEKKKITHRSSNSQAVALSQTFFGSVFHRPLFQIVTIPATHLAGAP